MEKHNNKCKFVDKEGQALLWQLLSHRNLGPRALYQLKAGELPALHENYFRRCPCRLRHFIPLISASLAVLIQDYDAQLENSAITLKNPRANAGDIKNPGFIPVLGTSPGVGNGSPLQYSCLGNPMDRGNCWVMLQSTGSQSWMWLKRLSTYTAHNNEQC